MPTSYQPLVDFLSRQPPETTTVTLTLAEVEGLLGVPLPEGAWTRLWWLAGGPPGVVRPWVAVGWRVTRTSLQTTPTTVTFARRAVDRMHTPFARLRRPPSASA